jgi:rubrerythrin
MGEKTQANVKAAFQGESEAHFRNRAYARVAAKEGYAQIAKLFRAMAEAEAVHALNMLRLRGIVKDTESNLEHAFSTEGFAKDEAYPKLIRDAEEEGDRTASLVFSRARDVEERHAALYKKAIADMMAERETDYYVCTVCGYVEDGQAPDECPICLAKKDKFEKVG